MLLISDTGILVHKVMQMQQLIWKVSSTVAFTIKGLEMCLTAIMSALVSLHLAQCVSFGFP